MNDRQLIDEFLARVKHYRAWSELHRFFEQFTHEALGEFTGYRGHDSEKLMLLRAKWLARLDFQNGIEALITDQADMQDQIKEEYERRGNNPDQLEQIRSIFDDGGSNEEF